MTDTTCELAAIRLRIRKLDRHNRACVRLLALAAIVGGTALLTAAKFNAGTVEASRFLLKDDDGKTVGELENGPKGPRLFFYGDDGQSRVGLFATDGTSGLVLNTKEMTRKVTCYASDDETGVNLDRRGKLRSVLAVEKNGTTAFVMKDADGTPRLTFLDSAKATGLALTRPPGKENGAFLLNEGGSILELIDAKGKVAFRRAEK